MSGLELTDDRRVQLTIGLIIIILGLVLVAVSWVVIDAMFRQLPPDPNIELWSATSTNIMMASVLVVIMVSPLLYFVFMAKSQQCPKCKWWDHSYFKRKTCPRCGASYQSNADETTKKP
jgi:hypothetical protein